MTTLAASQIAREDAKLEVRRFLEFIRNRNAAHKPKPKSRRGANGKTDNTSAVLVWLKAQAEPQTVEQIAAALGLHAQTVREIIRRHRKRFIHAGNAQRVGRGTPHKLWGVQSSP